MALSPSPDELKERFLEAFVEHRGNTDAARQACNIDRRVFYRWLRDDPVFRDRLDSYRILLAEEVEGEAFRRALSSKGSDNLVVTLLRGLRRDRYGEQQSQQIGQVVYVSLLREKDRPGIPSRTSEEPQQ